MQTHYHSQNCLFICCRCLNSYLFIFCYLFIDWYSNDYILVGRMINCCRLTFLSNCFYSLYHNFVLLIFSLLLNSIAFSYSSRWFLYHCFSTVFYKKCLKLFFNIIKKILNLHPNWLSLKILQIYGIIK